jgi:UDP-2,3-diacylglucosamine pyrophosphatase LpxH
LLLDFLEKNPADTIYLVGDIIDARRLQRGWFWPQAHIDVLQELLARAHDGAKT